MPAARRGAEAEAIGGRRPAQPSRWAAKTPTSCAASTHSSDPVGRGLTSTTQARSPSHTRSTPNSPRSSNADARCAQIACACVGKRASLRLAEPRRHDVPAPRVPARAEPALTDELLADAEHDGRAPVGDGRGRAREPGDVLLHHHVAVQCPAAPLAHAPSAAAADRLAQPAAGALGQSRRVGGGERRRVGEAGLVQRGAERRRCRAPARRSRACTRAASCRMPAGRRDPAGSRVPRRRSRSAPGCSRPRPPAPPCRRDRRGRAARRRSGRAAAGRDRRSDRGQRRRGQPSLPAPPACAR